MRQAMRPALVVSMKIAGAVGVRSLRTLDCVAGHDSGEIGANQLETALSPGHHGLPDVGFGLPRRFVGAERADPDEIVPARLARHDEVEHRDRVIPFAALLGLNANLSFW